MTYESDYNQLLPELQALPKDKVWRPRVPVDVAAQEGENLHKWVQQDKDILVATGLDWALVESLPQRAGALRQAASNWTLEKSRQREARDTWESESPEAFELRHFLVRTFRYAFKDVPKALDQLRKVTEGGRQSDMVLDLNTLAEMGIRYAAELEAIQFNTELLVEARNMAKRMGDHFGIF